MNNDLLVQVEDLSKKFCRSLKRSLWYGVQDVTSEILGSGGQHSELRKNEFWAVNNVSFELRRGECLGLIGPNGSGKSTLLKMLNGLVKPDKGRITMRGRVGALIELGAGFNPILTGRENIYVNGSVLGFSKNEIDRKFDAIVDFAEIEEFIDTPVQNYSSGMQVRLGFAVAAQMEPDVLLIDEVLAVGDIKFRMSCYKKVLTLKQSGTAILFVSHSMLDVMRICDSAILMNKGQHPEHSSVTTAISRYQAVSLTPQSAGSNRDQGEVSIIQTRLLNSNGEECRSFATGDDVCVEISIKTMKRIPDARIVVSLISAIGTLSSIGSPYQGFKFDIDLPMTIVVLRLHKIPLLIGYYQFSISVCGPGETDILDQDLYAAAFEISRPKVDPFGYGIYHVLSFQHSWDLKPH